MKGRRFTVWLAAALYAGAVIVGAVRGLPPLVVAIAALVPVLIVAIVGLTELRLERQTIADLQRRATDLGQRLDAATRDLARADARLRALDEPVLVFNGEGRIGACNPAAESLLSLRAERLTGRPAEEAFTQSELLALYERARGGLAAREQVRISRAEGIRIWDVSAIPLPEQNGKGPGVLMCLRDATATALALRVRADFVANASHELRTPIAAMRIALDTMSALEEGDEAMRQRLDGVIASNVARLEEMARDLLDLSRLESEETPPHLESVALSDLARELRTAYEAVCASRRLTLTFDIAPDADRLHSDRRLLSLILGNLIDNATKFAFEGTDVRIVARSSDRPSPNPTLANSQRPAASSPRSALRLEVIDRGVGIPLDQQQRVFERYYQVDAARTTNQPRRGTGLGLAIVKHAVRGLGGTIRVQSVWQQGTTMIVELPECVETLAANDR